MHGKVCRVTFQLSEDFLNIYKGLNFYYSITNCVIMVLLLVILLASFLYEFATFIVSFTKGTRFFKLTQFLKCYLTATNDRIKYRLCFLCVNAKVQKKITEQNKQRNVQMIE